MSVRDDTLAAVDGVWRTRSEILKRVGQWSRISIRRALDELAAQGLIEKVSHRLVFYRREGMDEAA